MKLSPGVTGQKMGLAYVTGSLDEMAAVVDHVMAHAKGRSIREENLATACSRWNIRKASAK